jgi:hypothetical protein
MHASPAEACDIGTLHWGIEAGGAAVVALRASDRCFGRRPTALGKALDFRL